MHANSARQSPFGEIANRQTAGWVTTALLVLLPVIVSLVPGCSRARYRLQADHDAYRAIAEKADDQHWQLTDFEINVDPRSRMFDPFDPDYQPMPADDPTSHELMVCVDSKRGYPKWWDNGVAASVENPGWQSYLPLDENGVLKLDKDMSVRLALIHSPDYQREFEDLYLSALDVTAERFRFDAQFFAGYEGTYFAAGRAAPGSGGSSTSLWDLSTRNIAVRKAYTSGAELVVGLANSLIWQVAGPDSHTATTILDFALVQPLLRRAGRDRIMETLTLAERTLLANVRQMERFRRGFQMDIVTGTGGVNGANRRGGFFGGSGLTGFTGVGGGGFGGVGGGQGGGGQITGAAQAGGFLGLLQDAQNIRNLETNITALRSSLAQLEAFRDAGRIDFFQVERARQDLFGTQSEFLNRKNAYQNSLDAFKRTLGLPPQVQIEIEDPLLEPFNLIDPQILPLQSRVADLQQQVGRSIISLLPFNGDAGADPNANIEIQWSASIAERIQGLVRHIEEVDQLRNQLRAENFVRAVQDIEKLEAAIPGRAAELDQLQDRLRIALAGGLSYADSTQQAPTGNLDQSMFDVERLQQLPEELRQSLAKLQQRLAEEERTSTRIVAELNDLIEQGPNLDMNQLLQLLIDRVVIAVPLTLTELSTSSLELSLIQARARTESILLTPVRMNAETALEIARVYRRDWMNARANLVDSWRLIQFNADSLESDLNILVDGDIRNVGDNPLRIRGTTGQLRVGVQFDAPITRLLERNVYRESLIDYQRARRSYYQFEDGIATGLRATLRQIELNQINFELRRAAVEVAVKQVELSRLRLQEPPKPGETQTLGPTTAQNLVDALTALRDAQDGFLSVWVNYEVTRRGLDLDLGTMQLDPEGLWVDPGPIGLDYGYPVRDLSELEGVYEPLGQFPDCLIRQPEYWMETHEADVLEFQQQFEPIDRGNPQGLPEVPELSSSGSAAPAVHTAVGQQPNRHSTLPSGFHQDGDRAAPDAAPKPGGNARPAKLRR